MVRTRELLDWYERYDVNSLLQAMHRVEVTRGDLVLVPAGLPHALGMGMFVFEVQENSDISGFLERRNLDQAPGVLDSNHTLGCLSRDPLSAADVEGLVIRSRLGVRTLHASDPECDESVFVVRRLDHAIGAFGASYTVIYAHDADAYLESKESPIRIHVRAGEAWLIPHRYGDFSIDASQGLVGMASPAYPDALSQPENDAMTSKNSHLAGAGAC
jgi:mannose-6-phosphate isomerase